MYIKTLSIRLFPNAEQKVQLQELISIRNEIWNNLIDITEEHYSKTKKTLSNYDMHKIITTLKKEKEHWNKLNAKATQRVATNLFAAYQLFFSNIKRKQVASTPKKIDLKEIKSLIYNQSGWSFKHNKIFINQIPFAFKSQIKNIEQLKIKEITVKYRNNKWLCDLIVEYDETYPETIEPKRVVAFDLGLEKLGTGIDSNGKVIIIPNKAKKISKHFGKQIAKIDSKLSKKKNGSRKHKKLSQIRKELFHKKNAQVRQSLHIQSKRIVNMNYHTIIIGDLSVKELMKKETEEKAVLMTTGEKAKRKSVRKSFAGSNVGMFITFLSYKCVGKANVIKVDERYTTQLNCLTNKMFPKKVELKDRTVFLTDKIEIDRDLNSAINIYNRWYGNQIVPLTAPLDLSNVLNKNNVFVEKNNPALLQEPPTL